MSEIISLPYQGSKTKFYESGHEIEIFHQIKWTLFL